MSFPADRIITATIGEFCNLSGIGRSLVYELIGDGRLESILIGKRRLIVLDSYRNLVARQQQQTAGAGGVPSPNPRARQQPVHPAAPAQSGRSSMAGPAIRKKGGPRAGR
jgi:excisionase family DNA binding protein